MNDRDSASGISKQTPWKEPRNGSMVVGVLILSPPISAEGSIPEIGDILSL